MKNAEDSPKSNLYLILQNFEIINVTLDLILTLTLTPPAGEAKGTIELISLYLNIH